MRKDWKGSNESFHHAQITRSSPLEVPGNLQQPGAADEGHKAEAQTQTVSPDRSGRRSGRLTEKGTESSDTTFIRLERTLTKDVYDLRKENCKTLSKNIKDQSKSGR